MSDPETKREFDPAEKRCIDSQPPSGGANYDLEHVPAPVEIATSVATLQSPSGWTVFTPEVGGDNDGDCWLAGEAVDLEVYC